MRYLRRLLWRCEELTGDEILPSDTLLCQLMYHYDLDQSVMIYILLCCCAGVLLYTKTTILSMLRYMKYKIFIIRTLMKCINKRTWYA